jgi:TonB-linked SusC/RagA family outer membrane protein
MLARTNSKRRGLLLLLVLSCSFAYAQKKITGSVTDPRNQPVSGATVVVAGSREATQTDAEGGFTITVPAGKDSLTISYVGHETQTMAIGAHTHIIVRLTPSGKALDNVIVVGYGTQRKSDVTGAIASVSGKDLEDEPVTQVGQALQGKVAGLQVSQNSGAPGSGLLIRVRGSGTVNNAEPLYVIDGNPNSNTLDLAPDQIESIQVLKSASAAAIYGAQGANGVILITTKQGRAGKSLLDVHFSQGYQQLQRDLPMTNATQYATLYNEGLTNAGAAPLYPNPASLGVGTDWQKAVFHTAPMTEASVSASGGSQSSRFYFSGGYVRQDGILKGSNFDRINIRINSSHTIIPAIKLGQNLSASLANYKQLPEFGVASMLGAVLIANPEIPVKNPDGSWGFSPTSLNSSNPAASLYYNNDRTKRPVLNGNVYAEITPLKNLVFRTQFNFNWGYVENKQFSPVYAISASQRNDLATLTENTQRFREYSWANTLTYQKTIGQHSFDVLAGITNQNSYTQNISAVGQGLPPGATDNPDLRYLDLAIQGFKVTGDAGEWGILSYLGRVNYNYDGKYFTTVNFRADGSSKFGANNKYGYFPSFSVGWKISQENFLKGMDWINNLMIRGGWGSLGNQNSLPNYAFANLVTPNLNYNFGDAVLRGQAPTGQGNPNLKWEATKETNIGFDFTGFEGRVTASFDWYNKKTSDILLQVPVVQYSGIEQAPYVNGGDVVNKGVEIMLGYQTKKTKGFNYEVSGNISFNKNKVTRLSNTGSSIFTQLSFIGIANVTQIGSPIASFYGWKTDGIFQEARDVANHAFQTSGTAPGDWRFRDLDGNDTINAKDQTIIGNPWPKFTYGFNFGASYNNLELRVQIQGTYGNDIYMASKFRLEGANFFNYTKNVWDHRWTGPGTSNIFPRLTTNDPNNNMRSSDYYVEDGSYLRVRNIQLSYRVPARLLKLRSLRVYASVQNAFTISKYPGFDPELGTNRANNPLYIGIDEFVYPVPRIYTVGLDFGL